jgi:hypothetical protein
MKQSLVSGPGPSSTVARSAPSLGSDSARPALENRDARLFHAFCLLVLFIIASSASFSAFYQKWHFREAGVRGYDPGVEFRNMIDGSARRPYIYRQLLPDTANWIARVLPLDAISRHFPTQAKEKISAAFDLRSKSYPVQYLIVYILTYLSALAATFALYGVCRAAAFSPPVAVFSAAIFMLMFPLFGVKGGYFFDYPELFFMAAAFWIALRADWWWLLPIAALGTWNKESFLLFTIMLYPVLRRRYSRPISLAAVAVLISVCAAVYLPIRLHFAHNPGGAVEQHLKDHLNFYLHPFALDTWIDRTYDLMFPALSSPFCTLLLAWTVWRAWRFLPVWLQRHAQFAALINIPLYFLFCLPGEFRDLSMLYISFLLIIAVNLQRWMQHVSAVELKPAA